LLGVSKVYFYSLQAKQPPATCLTSQSSRRLSKAFRLVSCPRTQKANLSALSPSYPFNVERQTIKKDTNKNFKVISIFSLTRRGYLIQVFRLRSKRAIRKTRQSVLESTYPPHPLSPLS